MMESSCLKKFGPKGSRGRCALWDDFSRTLREKRRPLTDLAPPSPAEQFKARDAVWLFIRQPTDLTEEEQATLTLIRQASSTAEVV